MVVDRDLALIEGCHVAEGDALVTISSDGTAECELSIREDDVETFQAKVGCIVSVEFRDGERAVARLREIRPDAALDNTPPALLSVHGGPVPIERREETAGEGGAVEYLTTDRRFVGIAELVETQSGSIHSGQTGWVFASTERRTIGDELKLRLSQWFENQSSRVR